MFRNSKLSCEALTNLANNALAATKLRADKMDLSYARADFTSIAKSCLLLTLRFCSRGFPEVLWTDGLRVSQILLNLVLNSLKFTPDSGKIRAHVTLYPQATSTEILLKPTSELIIQQISPSNSALNSQLIEPNDFTFISEFSLESSFIQNR